MILPKGLALLKERELSFPRIKKDLYNLTNISSYGNKIIVDYNILYVNNKLRESGQSVCVMATVGPMP